MRAYGDIVHSTVLVVFAVCNHIYSRASENRTKKVNKLIKFSLDGPKVSIVRKFGQQSQCVICTQTFQRITNKINGYKQKPIYVCIYWFAMQSAVRYSNTLNGSHRIRLKCFLFSCIHQIEMHASVQRYYQSITTVNRNVLISLLALANVQFGTCDYSRK